MRTGTASPGRPASSIAVASFLLVLGASLAVTELRRQGFTEALAFVPDERAVEAKVPALPASLAGRAPLARSLELYVLDGLRRDVAEAQPEWQLLAARGARLRARIRFPAQSTCGRALLATGAPPEVTGILGEGHLGGLHPDSLFSRAAASGMAITGEDWTRWLGLENDPLRGVPTPRALHVEDWFECDEAGHEFGGSSDEYRRVAHEACSKLLARARTIDLSRDALLALSDHGHADGGGHLGNEPEVAIVPVLLVGAGVRPDVRIDEPVAMEDIGATAGVLLGLGPPRLSRGIPVFEALRGERNAPLEGAFRARSESLARAWEGAVRPARVLAARALFASVAVALLLLALRPWLASRAGVAACLGPLLACGLWLGLGPPLSSAEEARFGVGCAGILFVASGASVALALALRVEPALFLRGKLCAWLVATTLLVGRFGLGAGGLPPDPASFLVVLAPACLATASLVAILGTVVSRRVRTRSRPVLV